MTEKLKQFIQDNKDLINQNTKDSWEEIYSKLAGDACGNFTEIMLSAEIDPSSILEYIPRYYLRSSKIQQYKILDSVTTIGFHAFYYCKSLMSIVIPDGVTSIGSSAFSGCDSLTSIEIPDRVTSIGSYAFADCTSLTNITFNGTMEEWNAIEKGIRWNYNVPATKVVCSDGEVFL